MPLNLLKKYLASSSFLEARDERFLLANFVVELNLMIVLRFLSTKSVQMYYGTSWLIGLSIVLLYPLLLVIGSNYDLNSRFNLLVGSVEWTAPKVFLTDVMTWLVSPCLSPQ